MSTRQPWSPEELRQALAGRAEGLTHKAISERLGRSRSSVAAYLSERGYSTPKPPNWTAADDWRLMELLERHVPYAEIGHQLGRSPSACRTRADRIGSGGVRTAAGDLSGNQAAQLLGVDHHTLCRWMRAGYLEARWTAVRYARGRMIAVTREAIEAFLSDEQHWHRIDPRRITDPALREWATELRGGRYFLTLRQVEDRLSYGFNSAGPAVTRGRLRAVRDARGPWLVRDDWLSDMAAPPRKLTPIPICRVLRPADLETLRALWGRQQATQIAEHLGTTAGTIRRAANKLGLQPLGKGWWAPTHPRRRAS